MGGDVPLMSERILEAPKAVTVKLVLHRAQSLGAGLNRTLKDTISVFT